MATKGKNPAAATAALVSIRALEPIRADGQDFAPGDEFDLAQADALALVEGGAAELVAEELPGLPAS